MADIDIKVGNKYRIATKSSSEYNNIIVITERTAGSSAYDYRYQNLDKNITSKFGLRSIFSQGLRLIK